MTLDEGIRHAEDVAARNEEAAEKLAAREAYAKKCKKCAAEHRQLAEWLKELKEYRENTCGDAISRQAVMDCFKKWQPYMATRLWDFEQELSALPPVTPQYTDVEIQKIQEMEQAEIQKAYELGKAEMHPCDDAISRKQLIRELNAQVAVGAITRQIALDMITHLLFVTPQQSTGQRRRRRMQIVIEIPEHIYKHAKEMTEDSRDEFEAMRAIANGSQQRSGRWIEYVEPDDAEPLVLWRCDNCRTIERRKTIYCPNCGAKMEVEE